MAHLSMPPSCVIGTKQRPGDLVSPGRLCVKRNAYARTLMTDLSMVSLGT